MLSGAKPMALFSLEPGMDPEDVGNAGFEEHVSQGRILRFVDFDPQTAIETYRYCLPTEEWRAKLSQLIARMCREGTAHGVFTPADLARIEGMLLGYPKECVEAFVARSAARFPHVLG
jgi:hypothetical protein